MASTSQLDGNGRLWERFELANINERIENIYQHFKNFEFGQRQSGDLEVDINEQENYLNRIRAEISAQLNELINDLEIKYNQKTKPWKDENIKLKSDLNDLENKIRDLNRENNENNKLNIELKNKYSTLKNGIDQIIKESNKKNVERINKLQLTNKKLNNEKNNISNEKKKEKKKHNEIIGKLEEEYDDLKDEYNKMRGIKNDLSNEKDNLFSKCANLEGIIRENKEFINNNLSEELSNLKAEKLKLEKRYDTLYNNNDKLNNEYRILLEKYDLEKDIFKKAIAKQQIDNASSPRKMPSDEVNRDELRKLREELNLKYSCELKKRENEWIKAKNDSIKTLDKQYNEIREDKEKQISFLENSNNELKKSLNNLKSEISRLRDRANTIDELQNKIQLLQDELNKKQNEITSLRTELSKYKILWQHFFGLHSPLKDEIERVNNKLDKFENYHNIQSPIPKKRRRVIIESLSQWKNNKVPAPVILDTIPSPNDIYQRFELYNISQKVIELKGFKLQNGFGDIIELDSRQIKPGSCIPIALKQKRNQFDILYNKNNPITNKSDIFCNFNQNEVIYLCDSFDEKIQIFPVLNEIIYDNLVSFQGELGTPIFVKQLFNQENGYKGFEFGNQTRKKIKLQNMYFKNQQNTFNISIPNKSLPQNGVIRLIITNNENHPKIKRNDLIIQPEKVNFGINDTLLLCDSHGNEIKLYEFDGTDMDINLNSPSNTQRKDCFIM